MENDEILVLFEAWAAVGLVFALLYWGVSRYFIWRKKRSLHGRPFMAASPGTGRFFHFPRFGRKHRRHRHQGEIVP